MSLTNSEIELDVIESRSTIPAEIRAGAGNVTALVTEYLVNLGASDE